jgi:hypothetical protein
MEIIKQLRDVLEINLNYMDLEENSSGGPADHPSNHHRLESVRRGIDAVKSQQKFVVPCALVLTILVSVLAILSFIGEPLLPWNNLGFLVLLLIPVAFFAFSLNNRLERLKRRELFLMMLYKIDGNVI